MTLGVYQARASWLHRRDPRAKLAAALCFLVAVAVAQGVAAVGLVALAAGALWRASGQGARDAVRAIAPLASLAGFVFLVNGACVFGGLAGEEGMMVAAGAALASAVLVSLKLVAALLGAATVMATTPPVMLTAAFRWFLAPGVRLGLRVEELAFSLTMVLRFAPLLAEEALRIRAAQMSRGATFDAGGVAARVRSWVPVVTPLFVGALRRCDRMADAVASRAFFASKTHTSLVQLRGSGRDVFLAAAAFALVIASVVLS